MDTPSVCRTCLSNLDPDKGRPLFKESLICSQRRRFLDLLLECIPSLQIPLEDDLPKYICTKCSLSLKHFIRFRSRCIEADQELKTHPERFRKVEPMKPAAKFEHSEESDTEEENEWNNAGTIVQKEDKNTLCAAKEVAVKSQMADEVLSTDPPLLDSDSFEGKGTSLQCEYCNKVLGTQKSFKCHMQLHSDLANFLCNRCGERFKTKMSYLGHMASHDPERYKCDVCGKSYRQAASLRNHKLNHTQEKPFACEICGHRTTQKSGLKKHMLTHSESKPFVCDLCGEHFRFSSNLIMHKRRRHMAVKDHVCSHCSKAFVSKDELANHLMCHTDERPFQCHHCQKRFNRKNSLHFHMKYQHSITPKHACNVCEKGFTQKVTLQNHLKRHILTD